MAGGLVLTVDELRGLSRELDMSLPRFVTAGDDDDVRVDAAALRGLAARGLVSIPGAAEADAVEVPEELALQLEPCQTASLLVEVEVEVGCGDRLERHALVGAAGGPVAVLSDCPAGFGTGFVSLVRTDAPVPDLLARLCRFDELARLATAGPGFMVDADAQAEADELALEGDQPGSVAVLTAAGAPPDAARDWVSAVCTRRRAVAVSVARNLGDGPDGPFESSELRWLVAGDGTGWRVAAGAPARPEVGPPTAVVGPVGQERLAHSLTVLIGRRPAPATPVPPPARPDPPPANPPRPDPPGAPPSGGTRWRLHRLSVGTGAGLIPAVSPTELSRPDRLISCYHHAHGSTTSAADRGRRESPATAPRPAAWPQHRGGSPRDPA